MKQRIDCVLISSGGGPLDMGSAVYAIPTNGRIHKVSVTNDCVGNGRLFARHEGFLDKLPLGEIRWVALAYTDLVRSEIDKVDGFKDVTE